MSLSPQPPGRVTSDAPPQGETSGQNRTGTAIGWQRRLLRISLALFTFEVGIFLVLFPWTESWNLNWFQSITGAHELWRNASFRGAITGLGLVNLYIACLQAVHSFRRR